jgi:hypothetical protein
VLLVLLLKPADDDRLPPLRGLGGRHPHVIAFVDIVVVLFLILLLPPHRRRRGGRRGDDNLDPRARPEVGVLRPPPLVFGVNIVVIMQSSMLPGILPPSSPPPRPPIILSPTYPSTLCRYGPPAGRPSRVSNYSASSREDKLVNRRVCLQ